MEEKESEQNWAAISIASSSWSCNVENQVKCYRGSPTPDTLSIYKNKGQKLVLVWISIENRSWRENSREGHVGSYIV